MNRFIGEGGRLFFDILKILNLSESLNLKSYIVTIGTQKSILFSKSFFFTCLS